MFLPVLYHFWCFTCLCFTSIIWRFINTIIFRGFTWTKSFPELLPELGHFRCLQLQYFRFRCPQPDHTGTEGDPIHARTWTKSTTRKTMFRQTPWFCVSICLFGFEIGYFYYLCFENNFNYSLNLHSKLIDSCFNNTVELIWVWKFWRLFLSVPSSKDLSKSFWLKTL